MADWDKAAAQAQKILGKDGKIPDLPSVINKAAGDFGKANTDFKTAREATEDKLLDLQNTLSALTNAFKQFAAKIDKEDFDLDTKNKDDAKKIQMARKILSGEIAAGVKEAGETDKTLSELDKHLIQLGKYKPPANLIG